MKVLHIIIYIGLIILVNFASSCENKDQSNPIDNPKIESVILSGIKQKADLVTTEITVRKLAIYDSSKHERFQLTNPATWKYGERKCIIPVEATIQYGYDLKEMGIDDVKLSDDSTAIYIILPEAKIINSDYEPEIKENEIVSMVTGLRSSFSPSEIAEIKHNAYKAIKKEDFKKLVYSDIKRNATNLFTSIAKQAGIKNKKIVVMDKEDGEWKR